MSYERNEGATEMPALGIFKVTSYSDSSFLPYLAIFINITSFVCLFTAQGEGYLSSTLETRGQLAGVSFSFCLRDPGDGIEAVRLGSKCSYLLSHLVGPVGVLFCFGFKQKASCSKRE